MPPVPRSASSSCDRLGEQVECGGVVERARHEAEPLGEVAPDVLAEGRPGVLLDRVVDDLAEVLGGPVAAGEADEREARRQQPAVGEVVDGGHELLAGEVAGDAEEDEAARTGDAGEALVLRVRRGFSPCATRAGLIHALRLEGLANLGQSGVVVGQVQPQHRSPVVGEHLGVAACLRRDERRRR